MTKAKVRDAGFTLAAPTDRGGHACRFPSAAFWLIEPEPSNGSTGGVPSRPMGLWGAPSRVRVAFAESFAQSRPHAAAVGWFVRGGCVGCVRLQRRARRGRSEGHLLFRDA